MTELWDRKYKPKKVEDIVMLPHHKEMLESIVRKKDVGNPKLFYGPPGHGKTLSGNVIIRNSGCDYKVVNGSDDNSIDYVRKSIMPFMGKKSTNGKKKILMIDECLDENEEIMLINDEYIRIGDMVKGENYNVKSLNLDTGIIEDDTGEVISDKEDDIYEVELEDGRIIKLTYDHPFIIKDSNGKLIEKTLADGLKEGDNIVSM